MTTKITVLGAGSWGSALAMLLARNQYQVTLWGKDAEQIKILQQQHVNQKYLPDIRFSANVVFTDDLTEAVRAADYVLLVIPSHAYHNFLPQLKPLLDDNTKLACSSKGFCQGQLLHQVVQKNLGNHPFAIISGPSFAIEVAHALPTAVVVAGSQKEYAQQWAKLLNNDTFRPYVSTDIIGVEIAGSVKNVLAIATGIADGMQLGCNARAALITRGLAEITRLGVAMGAESDTFMSLAGVGDVVLTCTDNKSRNYRFGLALGQGKSVAEAQASIDQVIEGINTTQEAYQLAEKNQIDMPITEQIYNVLFNQMNIQQAIKNLLSRDLKVD